MHTTHGSQKLRISPGGAPRFGGPHCQRGASQRAALLTKELLRAPEQLLRELLADCSKGKRIPAALLTKELLRAPEQLFRELLAGLAIPSSKKGIEWESEKSGTGGVYHSLLDLTGAWRSHPLRKASSGKAKRVVRGGCTTLCWISLALGDPIL